jgi:hypothetical protein
MAIALIEDPRTTLYRQKLATLLRRSSCRWISFSVGTAPIHRHFFENVAAAIEGLPTGVQHPDGVGHRQVQYGVRLRILAREHDQASYDSERDLLIVPEEAAFDTLDGQAKLVSACVHFGLDLEARNHQPFDSECAARIAGHLYRLYETVAAEASEQEAADKVRELTPASSDQEPFFAVAADILRHCRATLRANRRSNRPLQPGSFIRIVGTSQRCRLHDMLRERAPRQGAGARRPSPGVLPRSSRFLALQSMRPAALRAA